MSIIKRLAETATIVAGYSLPRPHPALRTESFPVLTVKDVGRQLSPRESLETLQIDRAEALRYSFAPGDVVVTTRGADIRAVVIPPSHAGVIAGANLATLRPQPSLDPVLLAAFLREPRTRARLLRETAGASTPGFTLKALSELTICLPPLTQQRALVRFIEAAEAHREALLRSIELREQVCNDLISASLSGEPLPTGGSS